MLKSTHLTATSIESSLPAGWTEHKAPSGHTYYYNASTKQSTYTRPSAPTEQDLQIDYHATKPDYSSNAGQFALNPNLTQFPSGTKGQGVFTGGRSYQDRPGLGSQNDRPKSKKPILNCEPWVLVMTKMKRRFVWNSETNDSFWKFPQDVMLAVIEMERVEREQKDREETVEGSGIKGSEKDGATPTAAQRPQILDVKATDDPDDDSDEYEEVEVTDDEDEGGAKDSVSKRPRTEEPAPAGPVEFNEDDIAYQLAQMGEDYGLDPGEYDNPDADEDYLEGEEGLPLTEEDSAALFRDLLDDHKTNPYTTFDRLIEDGHIIEDDRYTVLQNMTKRREIFNGWSTDRIKEAQAKKAAEKDERAKKDPRVGYLKFLHEHATLKLYWPEFRRKFKKEAEMQDPSFPDKEREKLYREYTTRLKISESDRAADLLKLLKVATSTEGQIHRDTTVDTLPNEVLRDAKFHALPAVLQFETVESYCAKLPTPMANQRAESADSAEVVKRREERRRREDALAERQRRVEEEKRRTMGAVRHGREMMREGAEELERAKRVGREGLMSHMDE